MEQYYLLTIMKGQIKTLNILIKNLMIKYLKMNQEKQINGIKNHNILILNYFIFMKHLTNLFIHQKKCKIRKHHIFNQCFNKNLQDLNHLILIIFRLNI